MRKRKRIPKSIKKYVRKEKARLKREILDLGEYKKKVRELYDSFTSMVL